MLYWGRNATAGNPIGISYCLQFQSFGLLISWHGLIKYYYNETTINLLESIKKGRSRI